MLDLLLVSTLEFCIHNLHVTLNLNYRLLLHPVNSQSSHEGLSLFLSQADPQVDHKSRDQALHQVSVRGTAQYSLDTRGLVIGGVSLAIGFLASFTLF